MHTLNTLKNTSLKRRPRKLLGRGIGSGRGKTCCRGQKGAGARAGYTRRLGYEGGQFRLFMKLPIRGFSNVRFRKALDSINLNEIERNYNDGETVNETTLRQKGLINRQSYGIKILGNGELTKKVKFEVNALSATAREKLKQAKVSVTILTPAKSEEA